MKGTVVATWIKTCKRAYGEEITKQAMASSGWAGDKIFSPLENVDDKSIKNVMEYIARATNQEVREVWNTVGRGNAESFKQDFPAFFQCENFYSFLRNIYNIHIVMTKKFRGANPPYLVIEPISSREGILVSRTAMVLFTQCMSIVSFSEPVL